MKFSSTGLLTVISLVGVLFVARPLRAAIPYRLPSTDLFEALFELLEEVAVVEEFHCPVGDCPCPTLVGGEGQTICTDELFPVEEGRGTKGTNLSFILSGEALRGEELTLELRDDGTWKLEIKNFRYQSIPDLREESLSASKAIFILEDGGLVEASLDDVSWDNEFAAERLRFDQDGWTLEGIHAAFRQGLPIAIPAARAKSGVLPPELFLTARMSRASVGYYLARPSISVHAALYEPRALGLEVGYWSRPQSSQPIVAVADLLVSERGLETLVLGGELDRSQRPVRIGTSGDSLIYPLRPPPIHGWHAHRDHLAATRTWRSRHAGLRILGEHGSLQLFGQGMKEGSLTAHPGEQLFDDVRFGLRYSSILRLPGQIDGTLDLTHLEARTYNIRGRETTANLAIERTFGSVERFYLRPQIRSHFGIDVEDSSTGTRAWSRAHIDAVVEAGLGLRGRPAGRNHVARPAILIARRTQLITADEVLPFSEDEGSENFQLLTLQLLQSLSGQRLQVQVPLALIASHAAQEELELLTTYGVHLIPSTISQLITLRAKIDGETNLSNRHMGLRLSLDAHFTDFFSFGSGALLGRFDPRLALLPGTYPRLHHVHLDSPLVFSQLHVHHSRFTGALGWTGSLHSTHEEAWIAGGAWNTLTGLRIGLNVGYSPNHHWSLALGLQR